jgi:hypothetical protein
MVKFKHDVNKVIEGCAEALAKKMEFNPMQVIRHFQLFGMDFFENTPDGPVSEIEDWYYLRDSLTHAAVIYNHETKELHLVEPEEYWKEEVKTYFREPEEKIQEELEAQMKIINETLRSESYRKIKHVLKWFTECPLPWVQTQFLGYTTWSFVLALLKYYPKWFNLKEDEDFKEKKERIVDAFHYEEYPVKKKDDEIKTQILLHHRDGKSYIDTSTEIRTATDVLEFMIKHSGKKFTASYDEDSYYKYPIDVYF